MFGGGGKGNHVISVCLENYVSIIRTLFCNIIFLLLFISTMCCKLMRGYVGSFPLSRAPHPTKHIKLFLFKSSCFQNFTIFLCSTAERCGIRQGLIEPAIEYATESGAFDHALELARTCCPSKLPGIHLKHALFLEDEERFKEVIYNAHTEHNINRRIYILYMLLYMASL